MRGSQSECNMINKNNEGNMGNWNIDHLSIINQIK